MLKSQFSTLRSIEQNHNYPILALGLEKVENQAQVLLAADSRGVHMNGMRYGRKDESVEEKEKFKRLEQLVWRTILSEESLFEEYAPEVVNYLKSGQPKLGRGIFNLARFAPSKTILQKWEQKLEEVNRSHQDFWAGKIDTHDTGFNYVFAHDILDPFVKAGWIENEADIEQVFKLAETIHPVTTDTTFSTGISLPTVYFLIQASPVKDWNLVRDYMDYKTPEDNFFLLERYAQLDDQAKDLWVKDNIFFHGIELNWQLWNVFQEDHQILPEMGCYDELRTFFPQLSDFQLRSVFEMINTFDPFGDKDISPRMALPYVIQVLEDGKIADVEQFIRTHGCFHWKAFSAQISGNEVPKLFQSFCAQRHKNITTAAGYSSKFLELVWHLAKQAAKVDISDDELVARIFACDELMFLGLKYWEPAFIDFFFRAHNNLPLEIDPRDIIQALKASKYPIYKDDWYHYWDAIGEKKSLKATFEAIGFASSVISNVTPESSLKDKMKFGKAKALYAKYYEEYNGLVDDFSLVYQQKITVFWRNAFVSDLDELVKLIGADVKITEENIEMYNKHFDSDNIPMVFAAKFFKTPDNLKESFLNQFKNFVLLFELCLHGGEDAHDLGVKTITYLAEKKTPIDLEQVLNFKKRFPLSAIQSSLLFWYLDLNSQEQDQFWSELTAEKKALIVSQNSVIDYQKRHVSVSTLAVLERVNIHGFSKGLIKVDASNVQPVPESFQVAQKIKVFRKQTSIIDQNESNDIKKFMFTYLHDIVVDKKEDAPYLPYLGMTACAEIALRNMQEYGQQNTESYKALSHYMKWADKDMAGNKAFAINNHYLAALYTAEKVARPIFDELISMAVLRRVLDKNPHLKRIFEYHFFDIHENVSENPDFVPAFAIYLPNILELFDEVEAYCDQVLDYDDYPLTKNLESFFGKDSLVPKECENDFIHNLPIKLKKRVMKFLKQTLFQKAQSKAEVYDEESVTLTIVGSPKNEIDYFYAKDTCVSENTEEINNADFIPFRILNESENELIGFIWCVEEVHPELGKILVLSDIHPNLEYRGRFDPESLYSSILNTLESMAKDGEYTAIVQTNNERAQSNDAELRRYIGDYVKEKPQVKLSGISHFPRRTKFDISDCTLISKLA